MRIITPEEEQKMTLTRKNHSRKSALLEECSKLNVGETLFMSMDEWRLYKYAPTTKPAMLIASASYQLRKDHPSRVTGMKFSTKAYNEGWVIKRIK